MHIVRGQFANKERTRQISQAIKTEACMLCKIVFLLTLIFKDRHTYGCQIVGEN